MVIAEAQVTALTQLATDGLSLVASDLPDHCVELVSSIWRLRLARNRVWIPDTAADLQLRLCVCAHSSLAGHRPATATAASLADFCWWSTQKADVEFLSVIVYIVPAYWVVVLAHWAKRYIPPSLTASCTGIL